MRADSLRTNCWLQLVDSFLGHFHPPDRPPDFSLHPDFSPPKSFLAFLWLDPDLVKFNPMQFMFLDNELVKARWPSSWKGLQKRAAHKHTSAFTSPKQATWCNDASLACIFKSYKKGIVIPCLHENIAQNKQISLAPLEIRDPLTWPRKNCGSPQGSLKSKERKFIRPDASLLAVPRIMHCQLYLQHL